MARSPQLKVLLFDMGGVCILSPFQAILDYEISLGIPPGWVNYSISRTSPDGFWHKAERGEIPLDDAFYNGFSKDLHDPARWSSFYQRESQKNPSLPPDVPPIPSIDARALFDGMMSGSRAADPWMYPALQRLKASGKYILAALSNTVIFPRGHPLHQEDITSDPVRRLFDVFISSAHVGIRKPDPKMYQFALDQVDKYARRHAKTPRGEDMGWEAGVKPDEILFLDDIGENLKAARTHGFNTLKVSLGKAYEAVDELEKATGLDLAGEHPRTPLQSQATIAKPKI